jgi:hypothetical protein
MIVIGEPLVLANNHHTNSCDHICSGMFQWTI